MADFNAKDAAGNTIPILSDSVTDGTLGAGVKQLMGIVDATVDGTNKLIVDSGGRAQVAVGAALPAGTNVIGHAIVDSAPSAARTSDSISAALATDAIMAGTTVVTPNFTGVTASASGATTIVNLVAAKKIRVLAFTIVCNGAVTVQLRSHTTTAQATGVMSFAANGGVSLPFSPVGWFESVAGEALDINLGSAVSVGGVIVYAAI